MNRDERLQNRDEMYEQLGDQTAITEDLLALVKKFQADKRYKDASNVLELAQRLAENNGKMAQLYADLVREMK